jgi:hypothetical protein
LILQKLKNKRRNKNLLKKIKEEEKFYSNIDYRYLKIIVLNTKKYESES